MITTARARFVRVSARKARLVLDQIRGKAVGEALATLEFTPRAAARLIEKVLRSAVANAEANHNLRGDELVVSSAFVDEGPVIKRFRARARGRGVRIQKPTCHITVTLVAPERAPEPAPKAEEPEPKAAANKPAAKKPAAKRKAPAKKKEAKA